MFEIPKDVEKLNLTFTFLTGGDRPDIVGPPETFAASKGSPLSAIMLRNRIAGAKKNEKEPTPVQQIPLVGERGSKRTSTASLSSLLRDRAFALVGLRHAFEEKANGMVLHRCQFSFIHEGGTEGVNERKRWDELERLTERLSWRWDYIKRPTSEWHRFFFTKPGNG
ncbi:MAG: hypothetical protein JWL75_681 [Parcubacteria group bacterium]|nr:hypothetical protein [Parcubacteria group bacterium]